ncbi:MAG: endonuclease III domain-containing protein [Terriglobales bacterium]
MPGGLHAVRRYYHALYRAWGPQDWWPARTRLEVVAGAILTQNTSWRNVERALEALRGADALSVAGLRRTSTRRLERLLRPAGYFRQKAARLKNFVRHLDRGHGGSLARMLAQPTAKLRRELLDLHGIGPETADSILLYAGGHASFVVDAYTRRVLERHGVIGPAAGYEEVRAMVETALGGVKAPRGQRPRFARPGGGAAAHVYNEFHALLVETGKRHCLKNEARCAGCPLEPFLEKRCIQ